MELGSNPGTGNHGAPARHTHAPVESNLDDVMRVFANNPAFPDSCLSRHPGPHPRFVHIKDMLWILLDRERRLEENLPPAAFRFAARFA